MDRDTQFTIRDNHPEVHFRDIKDMEKYFENLGIQSMTFKAHPIHGKPEKFKYDGLKKTVIREQDGRTFDSMEDFYCYCFHCDSEGYTHTEFVDITYE